MCARHTGGEGERGWVVLFVVCLSILAAGGLMNNYDWNKQFTFIRKLGSM